MGITYRQLGVNQLISNSENKKNAIGAALQAVSEKSEIIVSNGRWQGKAADSVKQYMQDVYPAILASFSKALEDINRTVNEYTMDYRAIEHNSEAVISESELSNIEQRVEQYGKAMSGISDDTRRLLNNISDIGQIPYGGIPSVENQTRDLVRRLKELRENIVQIESTYQDQATGHLADLITAALNLIKAQAKTDIAAYSQEALIQSPEYIALAQAYEVVADELEADAERIEKAQRAKEDLVQQLQEEYEERVRQAEKAKFWVGVACVVASVAVTVATGGAAAPLVGIATGAVTGAVSAGVSSYFDQSIGTVGCPGKVSWGKVFADAAVGGAIGAATSAIGAGFDKLGSGLTSTGFKKVATKVVLGGAKKAAQGFATDTIQGTYDALTTGGNVLKGMTSGFDLRKRASEFGAGCVSTGIKEGMGAIEKNDKVQKIFSPKTADGAITNDAVLKDSSMLNTLGNSAWHGAIETVAGSAGTFTKTLIAEGDVNKALDQALDVRTNAQTFLESTASEFATEELNKVYSKREKDLDKLQKEVDDKVKEQNKKIDKKQELLDEQGITRTENGGVDFKDSEAMVAETEIELTYDKSKKNIEGDGRPDDYENAYNQLVAEGKIDKDEYVLVKNMNKDQKQAYKEDKEAKGAKSGGAIVKMNDDGSMTYYTIHHKDDYDVRTGKSTVQLVETDAHKMTTGHGGSREQIKTTAESEILKQYQEIGNTGRKQALDQAKINDGAFDRDAKAREKEQEQDQPGIPTSGSRYHFMSSADDEGKGGDS